MASPCASCPRFAAAIFAGTLALPGASVAAQDTAPVKIASNPSGSSYVNLSLDALFAGGTSSVTDIGTLEGGGHDPSQRGFTVQGIETVLDGAVDPYFRGQANVVLQLTPDGETNVELEEAHATTTSLPHNLQVKVGQFLSEFGRVNPTHPHTWDFVDQSLVSVRMFGGDGLRSAGVRLSWLMPAPFYSELFLSAQNGHGETLTSFGSVQGETVFGRPIEETAVESAGDLLYVPRYAASFDLTSNQTLLVGASAAAGPNGTGPDGRTTIWGIDAFWKWKASNADRGFPFVKLQAEAMRRSYDAAAIGDLPATRYEDWGAFGQATWGFRPRWVLGARYDRVAGDIGDLPGDPLHEPRWRASAEVTFYATEFSKLRFQYSHDARQSSEDADSFWLQLEFLLGAHAAHKF